MFPALAYCFWKLTSWEAGYWEPPVTHTEEAVETRAEFQLGKHLLVKQECCLFKFPSGCTPCRERKTWGLLAIWSQHSKAFFSVKLKAKCFFIVLVLIFPRLLRPSTEKTLYLFKPVIQLNSHNTLSIQEGDPGLCSWLKVAWGLAHPNSPALFVLLHNSFKFLLVGPA